LEIPLNYIIPFLTLFLGLLLGRWINRAEEKHKEKKRRLQFNPLAVEENGVLRYFTWRGRDPVHLIGIDYQDKQLLKFFVPLCEELRRDSGMEPQFNLPNDIKGEIVYELSSDFRAKWRLLGGYGGDPGNQVLVLISR